EYLLPCNPHVRLDVDEETGRHVVTASWRGVDTGWRHTACHQPGALCLPQLQVGEDLGAVLGVDERTDLGGRIERVAQPHSRRAFTESLRELVVDTALYQNAAA